MNDVFAPDTMPPFMRGEDVRKNTAFYWRLVRLVDLFMKPLFAVKVEGIENLPLTQGFVLTPNHDNTFDPILMSQIMAKRNQPIHWLAKIELFRGGSFRLFGIPITVSDDRATRFMYNVRCVPMTRERPEGQAVKSIRLILEKGGVVGIFPEGTRHRNRNGDTALKTGAIKFASRSHVAVVPARVKSTMPTLLPPRRGTYELAFGRPILPQKNEPIEQSLESLRQEMQALGCFD